MILKRLRSIGMGLKLLVTAPKAAVQLMGMVGWKMYWLDAAPPEEIQHELLEIIAREEQDARNVRDLQRLP